MIEGNMNACTKSEPAYFEQRLNLLSNNLNHTLELLCSLEECIVRLGGSSDPPGEVEGKPSDPSILGRLDDLVAYSGTVQLRVAKLLDSMKELV